MATKMKTEERAISIPSLDIRLVEIKLVGDSPLICHAWSTKAKQEMLGKQMKKAKMAKEAKDPFRDYCESLHWVSPMPDNPKQSDVDKAEFGFPVVAFKSAAVDACSHVDGMTKVLARGAFHIIGEMAVIDGHPVMREDMVRIGMGTADIRYRGEFQKWSTKLTVRYNTSVISTEQIVNLFNVAGFAIGVGEWRPQRSGSCGMFHIATEGEI